MGVYHLAPVGTSPGAVTSALSYLMHNKDEPDFRVGGKIVEALVLFPSWEVRRAEEGTPEDCVQNDYGTENKRRNWKRGAAVPSIIRDFVRGELEPDISIYICPVNVNDYDDCFDKIARVVLRFSVRVGKHLWANLTGGPNIVNAALLEVAFLSGLIARLYYTFLCDVRRYGKYLQPPSLRHEIFAWRDIPMVKTNFDEDYYRVVKVLADLDEWYEDKDLLSFLAQDQSERFGSDRMNLDTFRRDFMNKMDGRELEREILPNGYGSQTKRNRVTDYGKKMVKRIGTSELLQMLLNPGRRNDETIRRLNKDLELEEL
jgi:hypothetical protein